MLNGRKQNSKRAMTMRIFYPFVFVVFFFERMKCPQLKILYIALLLQKITIKVSFS